MDQGTRAHQESIDLRRNETPELSFGQRVGKFFLNVAGNIALGLGILGAGLEIPHILDASVNVLDRIPVVNQLNLHGVAFDIANFHVERFYAVETGLLLVVLGAFIWDRTITPNSSPYEIQADGGTRDE